MRRTRGAVAVALAVALAHAANDAYSAFLHPLLPRIMEKLGLSIALAATLAMTLSLASSLVQPVMGYLADRYGRRAFVILGPVFSGVFLSLIGVAPSFGVLVACLALGGLGGAMFHPPGASLAARVADGRGSGLRYSVFSFGGSAGYAIGPVVAVGIVARIGLAGLAWAMVPVLVLALVLLRVLPPVSASERVGAPPTPAWLVRQLRGPLGLVFGISAAAAFVQRVFLTMEPIVMAAAGHPEAAGAVALSTYLTGQAFGSLAGGILSDHVDRPRLLLFLTLLAFPAHVLAVALPGGSPGALGAAFVAGLLNMAILPPVVLTAQEIVPAAAAGSSGIAMGLAWAAGSVGVLGTGVLGDLLGARTAALLSMPVILLGSGLALHPALRRHGRPAR